MAPETRYTTHKRSRIAHIQQFIVASAIASLLGAAYLWQQGEAALAAVVAAIAVSAHAWALAAECLVAAHHNKGDTVPPATRLEWLAAWWREVRAAALVFAWRQPFRWRTWPDSEGARDTQSPAVVFVHGFVCNRGFWLPWLAALRTRRVPYTTVNLEPVFGPIEQCAGLIEDAVARAEKLSPERPHLVCHSMGGLAVRAWLVASPVNQHRVGNIITIGTPHRGTWLARFSHVANGRQMVPNGAWLNHLAATEADQRSIDTYQPFVCWYTNTDSIVFPASTATLPGADNRLVRGAGHVDLAFQPRVMSESLAMLTSASSSPAARTAS